MQQFFLDISLIEDQTVPLSDVVARQLTRVLRYRGGESIRLVDAEGTAFLATVHLRGKFVEAVVGPELDETREVQAPLILALARIKRDKWEWALQKTCELGVTAIVPLETTRVNEPPATPHRIVRDERILREAAEQSERHRIPILERPRRLEDMLQSSVVECPASCGDLKRDVLQGDVQRIVLAERHEGTSRLREVLEGLDQTRPVILFVGPEGGFTEGEFQAMQEAGVAFASLGSRILRAETAAVFAVGTVAQWMGER